MILCDIKNAVIRNCNIYNCEIKKSSIEDSYIYSGTKVLSSKVKSTIADFSNELKDCYIDCEGKNLNCKIVGGVLRAGNIGENADVSKDTMKVKNSGDQRLARFITDKRLKDLNDRYNNQRFGNMNY